MPANIANTDTSLKFYELPDSAPNAAPKKVAGSAAPGVSRDGTSGAAPPAQPVTSQAIAVNLAPSSGPHDPEALRAASARFRVAAGGGPTGSNAADSSSMALSPSAFLHELFRNEVQSDNNQENDAEKNRDNDIEAARTLRLAAAGEDRKSADNIKSNGWQSFAYTCASACCSVGVASIPADKVKIAGLDAVGLSKAGETGFSGLAGKTASDGKADEKLSSSISSGYLANADEAGKGRNGADDNLQKLRERFAQLMNAIDSIGEQEAKLKATA